MNPAGNGEISQDSLVVPGHGRRARKIAFGNDHVRQDSCTIDAELIIDRSIVTKNASAFDASPTPDRGLPPYDGHKDVKVSLELSSLQDRRLSNSYSILDDSIGANDAVLANRCQ